MNEQKPMPLYSGATPSQVATDISQLVDFQSEGVPLQELNSLLADTLLPHLMRYDHPGFQSMFNAFPPPEAKIGAQVVLSYNQGVTNWQVSPGGAVLEELCCLALCKLFSLGPEADATFTYSGTYGNQQALYMALHRYAERQGFDLAEKGICGFEAPERLTVLASQEAHFSLKHAVRILGLGDEALALLPVDENWRVDVDAMQEVIWEIRNDRDIFCIVATAGTTSTGTVDPIEAMARQCAATGSWLHIDGAYGYAYKLVPEWSAKFSGDHQADSIVWDPHKQLGAPIPNSVLFVNQKLEFTRMALYSSYFNRPGDAVPNPGFKSLPSTRPMSALPLVTLLRGQGIRKVIKGLRSPLVAIRTLAKYLISQPDVEVLHQPDTGILCFRMTPKWIPTNKLDEFQAQLFQQVTSSGERSISITQLGDKNALRLVVVTPNITHEDLLDTIDFLRVLASKAK
jgi:L-2,4-diaminobutyrate decarboxylase